MMSLSKKSLWSKGLKFYLKGLTQYKLQKQILRQTTYFPTYMLSHAVH